MRIDLKELTARESEQVEWKENVVDPRGVGVASATTCATAAVGAVILLPDYGSKAYDKGRVSSGGCSGAGATGLGGLAATAAASRGDTRQLVAVDCSVG
jgi:hypothetical protein